MNILDFKGKSIGPQKIEYNWRDVALYALAVGAHEDEMEYFYEQNMKTLPSFGVVPYWNAINNYPQRPTPMPASVVLLNAFKEEGINAGGLHMEHEIIIHRPIDPIKGSLIFEDTITDIYDRGDKGISVKTTTPIYDEAGNLLCTNNSSTAFFAGGNFGGPEQPKSKVVFPDKEPDYVIQDKVSKVQNYLYRLTGDTNHIHANPDVAKAAGFPGPFMQGLCSFGFATRMGIKAIIPGQSERVTRVAAQMRNICWPGSDIEFRGWKDGEGRVVFQLVNLADGKQILGNGEFEYK